MPFDFDPGHKAAEATTKFCCTKSEDAVHLNIKCFKKLYSACKDIDYQAKTNRPKSVDCEAVLRGVERSSTRRVSGSIKISRSSVVHHLHYVIKCIGSYRAALHVAKIWPKLV